MPHIDAGLGSASFFLTAIRDRQEFRNESESRNAAPPRAAQRAHGRLDRFAARRRGRPSADDAPRVSAERVAARVDRLLDEEDYARCLQEIATLRGPVDRFFDGVLVMAEDSRVRNNRLALLRRINRMFETIADFSKLSTR